MIQLGLVYNSTNADYYVGTYCVKAKSYGRIPSTQVEWLLRSNNKDIIAIDGNPEMTIFMKTLHRPFNPRYKSALI